MSEAEFSRLVDVRQCDGQRLELAANGQERTALAARFDLVSVERLEAELTLARTDRTVEATGVMRAAWVQPCAISAEDLPQSVEEDVALRFVPVASGNLANETDEEIEISADELDEIPYEGTRFDIGEAIAQSLGLAIDPYAAGAEAEAARAKLGDKPDNPFAALKDRL